jgi:hypothetical protein
MQDWLKAFHGSNQAFPAMEIAIKTVVALAQHCDHIDASDNDFLVDGRMRMGIRSECRPRGSSWILSNI